MVFMCSNGAVVVFMLSFFVTTIVSNEHQQHQQEVNVISVENMDALLKLRLGNAESTTKVSAAQRQRQRREHTPLCKHSACRCANTSGVWINATCIFNGTQTLQLNQNDMPDNLLELRLENIYELDITRHTFSRTKLINFVALSRIDRITIHSEAFSNLNASTFFLDIQDCSSLKFEERCFRGMKGSVHVTISNCHDVSLGRSVFSWLSHFSLSNVPRLALKENSFSIEMDKKSFHGPAPSIFFHNTTLQTIPNATFQSSAAEIDFTECQIGTISTGAFNAMQISRLSFQHSQLNLLETGAFSEHTLIFELELNGVLLAVVRPYAFSPITNLTIRNSRINEIHQSALNNTVARLNLQQNSFGKLHHRAIEVREWNAIVITGNKFDRLDADALAFPFHRVPGIDKYTFAFIDNDITDIGVAGLRFLPTHIDIYIKGNRFAAPCSCRLQPWTESLVDGRSTSAVIYNSSLCSVTDWLGVCFKLPTGYMSMLNYTDVVCGNGTELICDDSSRTWMDDRDMHWDGLLLREKKMFNVIILTVVCSVAFLFGVVLFTWIKRMGLIGRILSQFHTSSLVSSGSISRVNLHEYAEIQNLRNHVTITEDEDGGGGDGGDDSGSIEEILVDDKSTQTLPEELTQDLLQTLREKLDDPDNYKEAREMIEHLYDLIKVEEVEHEESAYADLRRIRVPSNANTVNAGTRVPSLDKLAPVAFEKRFQQQPLLTGDYAEPRDCNSASTHVYCELPAGQPDVVMMLANRPLPSRPDEQHLRRS